eukprot:CAMPEP_0202734308 /NCGR_PEP_ID=MMETSP1385-20130828/188618_1 /ASSEMBLY_ACC=CAM_ASM_000861 /TAXON_ID=933848 /ORGANISM="Elphidium margaritaceum" /LENGTH=229 /DNA_ID=CAMNT_0049400667 /DNA_START=495 /DNA_END=1180 /DNA_ORIENTATION=+
MRADVVPAMSPQSTLESTGNDEQSYSHAFGLATQKASKMAEIKSISRKIDITIVCLCGVVVFRAFAVKNHLFIFETTPSSVSSLLSSPYYTLSIYLNQFLFMLCWMSALIALLFTKGSAANTANQSRSELMSKIKQQLEANQKRPPTPPKKPAPQFDHEIPQSPLSPFTPTQHLSRSVSKDEIDLDNLQSMNTVSGRIETSLPIPFIDDEDGPSNMKSLDPRIRVQQAG